MPLLLFVLFIAVPLIELVVILQVGDVIGAWPTVILLVVDSLIGAYLVRREGRRAWEALRTALSDMRWPGDEVAQGGLVLFGGALLLTPGFVTDIAGLLMVLPFTRSGLSKVLRTRLTPPQVRTFQKVRDRQRASGGSDRIGGQDRGGVAAGRSSGGEGSGRSNGEVMDVEVVSVERDEPASEDAEDRGEA